MMLLLLSMLYAGTPVFTDVTAQAGILFEHRYRAAGEPAYIAGGVAAADVDGDGLVDLFFTSGDQGRCALYKNNGDGTFRDITSLAGLSLSNRFNCGPVFADVDGDDRPDLLVGGLYDAPPLLFRNLGEGRFEDVTATSGLVIAATTYGGAFADVDRDGDLDLFTAHWAEDEGNFFWENQGDGRFLPADQRIGLPTPLPYTFTPNFADINGDGWPDLLLTSDLGNSRLFINNGNGSFDDRTSAVISDENGMGATVGDYDNDGDCDWFVSAIGTPSSGNRLYRNDGAGNLEDVTDQSGVRQGFWGWGAAFADLDNDGWLDIFHVNGFYGPFAAGYHDTPARLFHNNRDGSFSEMAAAAGIADMGQGRGVVCLDYDGDMDLDIVIANNGGPARLYRNDSGGNGLILDLIGPPGQRDAVGAVLTIESGPAAGRIHQVRAGNNFVSGDPRLIHLGLGQQETLDLTVQWPDGRFSRAAGLAAGQVHRLVYPVYQGPTESAVTTILPHITSADGGFTTAIHLFNNGDQPARVDLAAHDQSGRHLGNVQLDIEPAHRQTHAAAELFAGMGAVSHLTLVAPDGVVASAGYRRIAGGPEAVVHQTRVAVRTMVLYPGDPLQRFDGLALVNTSGQPARVTAILLDQAGHELSRRELVADLAPGAKSLSILSEHQDHAGAWYRIASDQPLAALALAGTHAGATPGLLYAVQPVPLTATP